MAGNAVFYQVSRKLHAVHYTGVARTKEEAVYLLYLEKSSSPTHGCCRLSTCRQMKSYAVLWFFLGLLCSAMLTAHSQACRTERQQCSPRNACCEGLACAPMFLDDKNPQLFYGNCLQSVPSSLSRSEPPKPERPDLLTAGTSAQGQSALTHVAGSTTSASPAPTISLIIPSARPHA
ncbi:hypothetical protein MRX96_014745 [Rhipicephalus microplus]